MATDVLNSLAAEIKGIQEHIAQLNRERNVLINALATVREAGHNNDCLFCARKDTVVNKFLKMLSKVPNV